MHILHTALYTFPKVLTRRICLPIKSFFRLWPFHLFSWPYRVIQGWYWKEKFHANHSKGWKGLYCKQIDSMLPRVCWAIDHRWRPPLPLPKMKRKQGNVYENLASVSPLGGGGEGRERVRLHVGYWSRRLRLINPTETLIILDITIKPSLIIVLLYIKRKKKSQESKLNLN